MNDPINLLCTVPPKQVEDNFLRPFKLSHEDFTLLVEQLPKITFELTPLDIESPEGEEGEEGPEKTNLEPGYCDLKKYSILQKLKVIHSDPRADPFAYQVYPYEAANNSIFLNRCSLKLANLDKIFQLTGHLTGVVNKQVPGKFMFCDIAGGPGGFTQYLQYRWPESIGFGITYKRVIDWKIEQLDTSRFNPIYGNKAESNGNLYYEWDFFARTIKDQSPQGVNLVVADGGFDVTEGDDFERQEFLSTRLISIEILLGIMLTKAKSPTLDTEGRRSESNPVEYQTPSFLFKVFDTVTQPSAFLLLMCSLAFEEVHIWKPVMSRWGNSERYVICRNRRNNLSPEVIIALTRMVEAQTENDRIALVKGITFPESFTKWLTERNNESIDLQTRVASQLIKLIRGDKLTDLPKVNLHQLLIVLDLPGERYRDRRPSRRTNR